MVCAIQRSNSQWYSEDEKNTNYVLNLGKRNCKQATKSPLRTNDKKYTFTDEELLSKCETSNKDFILGNLVKRTSRLFLSYSIQQTKF